MSRNYNIVIVGAGASALMLASLLPKNRSILIESNTKIGAKIEISGGGKCNITNADMGSEYYDGDAEFIETVLKSWNEKSLLSWLERQKLSPVLRKENQYFCPQSAKELIAIFTKEIKKQKLLLDEKVVSVDKRDAYFYIKTTKRTLTTEHLVIASGGLSFPRIGASSIGYDIAQAFEHSIMRTAPALVGFTVQKEQFFFKELSGSAADVYIRVGKNLCKGALLFTHKGMSGPAVLDASLYWQKGSIEIDFLPNVNWNDFKGSKKQITSLLPLAKRITKAFLVQLSIKDKAFNRLTTHELNILKQLNHYTLSPAGTFGYSKAEVTKGGVDTDEVFVHSMMSKKVERLYFIGEVLNVTGRLGGYNFQWAFSSAYQCFKSLSKE